MAVNYQAVNWQLQILGFYHDTPTLHCITVVTADDNRVTILLQWVPINQEENSDNNFFPIMPQEIWNLFDLSVASLSRIVRQLSYEFPLCHPFLVSAQLNNGYKSPLGLVLLHGSMSSMSL